MRVAHDQQQQQQVRHPQQQQVYLPPKAMHAVCVAMYHFVIYASFIPLCVMNMKYRYFRKRNIAIGLKGSLSDRRDTSCASNACIEYN